MDQKNSIVDNRRKKIIDVIKKEETVLVSELSELLDVSVLTIRRDLQFLESRNILERYYGGARICNNFIEPLESNIEQLKHEIAKKAADFVEDGDSIFINTSSTALLLIKYIKNKRVNIITNNGKSIYIERDPLTSLILSGGELRGPKESMTGDFAINNLSRVSADKSFLGCSGISCETGITTVVMQEVAINEIMLNRCKGSTFILADHTKIGVEQNFVSGSIDKVNHLITDNESNVQELEKIRAVGVDIIIA